MDAKMTVGMKDWKRERAVVQRRRTGSGAIRETINRTGSLLQVRFG